MPKSLGGQKLKKKGVPETAKANRLPRKSGRGKGTSSKVSWEGKGGKKKEKKTKDKAGASCRPPSADKTTENFSPRRNGGFSGPKYEAWGKKLKKTEKGKELKKKVARSALREKGPSFQIVPWLESIQPLKGATGGKDQETESKEQTWKINQTSKRTEKNVVKKTKEEKSGACQKGVTYTPPDSRGKGGSLA